MASEYTAQELDLIHGLTISSGTVSSLSSILLILTICFVWYRGKNKNKYLLIQSPNKRPVRLVSRVPVLCLALSDLGAAISAMLSVSPDGGWCQAQAFLIQYFYLASFLWTSCFCFSLYFRAKNRRVSKPLHVLFQILCWSIPLVIAVYLKIVDAYGFADTWCWIDAAKDTDAVYRLSFFYGPLWVCIFFNAGITFFTYRASQGKEKSVVRKLAGFPAIFVLCFLGGTILRISEMMGHSVHVLEYTHAFMVPLQGFFDAVLYGYTVFRGNVVLFQPQPEDLIRKSRRLEDIKPTPSASFREEEEKKAITPTTLPLPVAASSAVAAPKRDKKKLVVVLVFISVVVLRGSIQLILSFGDAVSPPFSLMWMRSLPACFILTAITLYKARRDKKFAELSRKALARPKIYHVYLAGALNMVLPFLFFSFGEIAVPVGVASIMTTTQPMMVVVLQQFLSKKKQIFTIKGVSGLVVGFLGAVLICAISLLEEDHKANDSYYFYAIYIVGVLLQSFGAIYWSERKTVEDGDKKVPIPTLFILTVQAYVGFTICLLPSLVWEYEWPISPFPPHFGFVADFLKWPGILVFLWLLFISGMVAFGLFYYLLAEIGPRATNVTYGFPLVGMIEGIIFRSEWSGYPWWACFIQVIGGVFVVVGLVLAEDIKEGKKPPAEPPKPEQQHLLADVEEEEEEGEEELEGPGGKDLAGSALDNEGASAPDANNANGDADDD